jgi:hypothetical protein
MHVSGFSRCPSSAPAEVTVVSGRFWQIVSFQREEKSIVLQRVAEKSAAFFVYFCPENFAVLSNTCSEAKCFVHEACLPTR